MKKTFRFLALSFALICGTLSTFAAATRPVNGPANGVLVGNTIDLGVVVYEVTGWDGTIKDASGKEVGAYTVEITGLNWTGIQTKPNELSIKLAFDEMYGKVMCKYVVTSIKSTTIAQKEAFYAQTNLTKLEFVNDLTVIQKPVDFTIGTYSFYGCNKLKELIFPDNVSRIYGYAFQDTGVVDFEIPGNCVSIDPFAFYNCKSLNTVTVRETEAGKGGKLTKLQGKVFANSTLKTLDLEKAYALTTIGAADNSPFLYNLSEINDQLTTVILPAAKSPAKKSLLTDIFNSFKNCTSLKSISNLDVSQIVAFAGDAFQNCKKLEALDFPEGELGTTMLKASPFKGCESLATLTFAEDFWGTIGDGANNLFGVKTTDAKSLAALKTITFKGSLNGTIKTASFGATTKSGDICTGLATLTVTKGLKGNNVKIGSTDTSYGATIEANAFSFCGALATVDLNGVTIGGDKAALTVTIAGGAFASTGIVELDLGDIEISNTKSNMTFALGSNVFTSSALESVKIGKITLQTNAAKTIKHTATINDAFVGGANFASFEVGDISNDLGTVTFGNGTTAVARSEVGGVYVNNVLQAVTFGDIATSGAVVFAADAFKSDALALVKFGNFKKLDADANTAESITINAGAFAAAVPATAVSKAIAIGEEDESKFKGIAATTTIAAGAFTGSSVDGTTYAAVIGDIKQLGTAAFTVTMGAKAFQGPAVGDVYYVLGEVSHGVSGVAAGAFEGATDANGYANTSVKIGDYKEIFPAWYTFTNINDLTINSYAVNGGVTKIGKPVTLTITEDLTGYLYGDGTDNTITELTIGGNITKSNSILQFGTEVRKIVFGKDKEIIAKAVASNAFEKASDAAAVAVPEETINVVYQCSDGNEAIYNPIFAEDAFGPVSTVKDVVLFTSVWAQNNIFENTMVYANGINRMVMSASSVVPGDPIEAKLVAAQSGTNKYGKLYIPKGIGMTYKIDAKVSGSKNGVNVFSGHLDGDNIYMKQIDTYKGYYWIDATDENQVFIVRTSDMTASEVTAEAVTEAAELNDAKNVFWFVKNDAKKNCLRFTPAVVVNQELQNNAEFMHKTIYVMANPAKYNLAFAKLNQYTTSTNLAKNSLYVVSETDPQAASARLNVIFDDEIDNVENATGIQHVEAEKTAVDGIYNLQGVRVKNAQKGIYIINGKKVIK